MRKKINVVIIENDDHVREGFEVVLNYSRKYKVCSTYARYEDALVHLSQDCPKAILMDIDQPGITGVKAILAIRQLFPEVNILLVTLGVEGQGVFEALGAGADSYIAKDISPARLIKALDDVVQGEASMGSNIAKMIQQSIKSTFYGMLPPKACKVLALLASGEDEHYVQSSLSVSSEELGTLVREIYRKLHLLSKEQVFSEPVKERFFG